MQGEINDSKVMVLFSLQEIELPLLPEGNHIVIFPSTDKFNNFGHRTICHFVARNKQGKEVSGIIHLAFMGDNPSPRKVIESVLAERNNIYVKSEELPQFFSMITTMQGYRDIVSNLGPKQAQNILVSINDLVVLNYRRNIPDHIKDATKTEVFRLSFLRNSETFFAFHHADSVLEGLVYERIGDVSNELNLTFQLDAFSNAHELKFKFDPKSLLPKRICVIIGKNGVGKSQALGNLVRSALNDDSSLKDGSGNRPKLNRLVAIGTPGEARVTFPAEQRDRGRIFYRRLLLSRNNGKEGWRGLADLLIQLARSEESIKGKDRWQIFSECIERLIPLKELAIPLQEGEDLSRWGEQVTCGPITYITVEKLRRNGEQARLETWGSIQQKSDPVRLINGKAYGLSSGQLAFLRFATQVCLFIDNATLLLLDEPEIHLHPNLISDFVDLVDGLLEATGSLAIIATHSVYFVREVPRSQTLVLQETSEGSIDVLTPRLRTFGADVGSISHFVFADNMTNKLLNKVKEKIFESNCDVEKFLKEAENELSMEAVMSLRRKLGEEAPV